MSPSYERVKIYSAYERIWHGIQASAVLLLLWTGLEIRGAARVLGFERSVRLHEALGFFLLANAALGLFYYVTSGAIRHYVHEPRDFATLAVKQALYYVRGIFRGEPHPVERSARARLNPLQKVVYVAILNLLLPWQIVSGLAIWGLDRWPVVERSVGGLDVLVPLHVLGAWLFAAFIVAHVYLTTTSGRRPLSGIEAMVTGWEDLPTRTQPASRETTT